MDWGAIKIYPVLNLNKYEYVEVLSRVGGKNTSMDREVVKNLSARQKVSRWIEKLLKQIPESSMNQNCTNFFQEKKKEGLNRYESVEDLLRSYQARRKHVFQREEKHIEMNATSKLLKHRFNQHIKLKKKYLSTKNCKAFKVQPTPPPTHTHTHTKQV